MKTYYLAYGSNLHPVRLGQRIASAVPMAPIELRGERIAFNKLGRDGSAKCSLVAVPGSCVSVWAALYQMEAADTTVLDEHEGLGRGYDKSWISILHGRSEVTAFTYRAAESHVTDAGEPFKWYRNLVLLGGRYFNFPPSYLQAIAEVPAVEDPDQVRSALNQRLIREAERHSKVAPWPRLSG